jgi:methylenetetrahydrofolate dehydrogenase (NADP+)/methenyltetrahydrofolate cyclohydrolase
MDTIIIDGKEVASSVYAKIQSELDGEHPSLAVVLVGDDPASKSYVAGKRKALAENGFIDKTIELPETITEEYLIDSIKRLNEDPSINGILVQLPLPKKFDETKIIQTISPSKDVDGLTYRNIGLMTSGTPYYIPCTAEGVLSILEYHHISTEGKVVTIIGRSDLVGRPLSILLSSKPYNSTVTLCHSKTKDIKKYTLASDIVIVAVGKPKMLTSDMVKEGAVVIDVGVNRVEDATKKSGFRLVGDTDFDNLIGKASYITKTPGGTGPMTIASLMYNTYLSLKMSKI